MRAHDATPDDDVDPVVAYRIEVENARDQVFEWLIDALVPVKGDPTGWKVLRHYQETKDELADALARWG